MYEKLENIESLDLNISDKLNLNPLAKKEKK